MKKQTINETIAYLIISSITLILSIIVWVSNNNEPKLVIPTEMKEGK